MWSTVTHKRRRTRPQMSCILGDLGASAKPRRIEVLQANGPKLPRPRYFGSSERAFETGILAK